MTTAIVGTENVNMAQLLIVRHGISLYLRTGMKPSRNWSPKNMRDFVSRKTGKQYSSSRKGLEAALADVVKLMESKS